MIIWTLNLRSRADYIEMRRRYEPHTVRLVVVAESPVYGLYFYDPSGAVTEPLSAALMKRLGATPTSKDSGDRQGIGTI